MCVESVRTKLIDPRTMSFTDASADTDSQITRSGGTVKPCDWNDKKPVSRVNVVMLTMLLRGWMKSTRTPPPVHAPVGTRMFMEADVTAVLVMSTISACGDSTATRVTVAVRPVNENVAPCAETPAISSASRGDYATRNVALPLMRAPTEPPIDAEAIVAVKPVKWRPPPVVPCEIERAPDVPAARMFVEM